MAVEMLNDPVFGEAPPQECQVDKAAVEPFALQRFLDPCCDPLQLHVYEEAVWLQ